MKYVVVLGDGMSGEPLEELGNRTTLDVAFTPMMDKLSKMSEIGLAHMVPKGMAPGSDTANLAVMGYNPREYYTGRSPLEALSLGVQMEESDVAIRCNVVTLSEEDCPYEERTIIDHGANEISTEEAVQLIQAVDKEFSGEDYSFYGGTSYRHLMLWNKGKVLEFTPPHDILTKTIAEYLPKEPIFREMMEKSFTILKNHPINVARRAKGLLPANSIWLWGAGTRPCLSSFEEKTGRKGAMISAVDLLKGIALGTDMHVIKVEGADGSLHTNYEGKARAATDALLKDGYNFVYIHVEAPDEMGHQGNAMDKIRAIEFLDAKIIRPVYERLEAENEDFRMLILPDHPTPISKRTHTSDAVQYLLYDSTNHVEGPEVYNEITAKKTGIFLEEGYQLMDRFVQTED